MSKGTKNLLLVLLIGLLLVAAILTFVALGISNPIPWLISIVLIALPFWIKKKDSKQFVVWKDEYSVGVESLDNDHRKLLNLINNFQTAVQYQTGEVFEREALEALVDYTKYHFKREEKMMEEAGFDDLLEHKKTHQKMIVKIDEFLKDYEQQGHEALEDVAVYLKDWLIGHINGNDQEYSSLLRDKGIK